MIDEKRLLEAIHDYFKTKIDENDYTDVDKDVLGPNKEIQRIIEEQPKVGEWIPCSKRLPEDDHYILISFENFSIPVVGRYEEDKNGGAFYVGDEDESCVKQDLFVNAWMPLPQSYKNKK